MEPDRDGRIPPGVLQTVAAIAGEHETDTELAGGLAKGSDLISGRRCQKKNASHTRSSCSGPGSAQQYHPSVIYGGVGPFARRRRSRVRAATAHMRSKTSPR